MVSAADVSTVVRYSLRQQGFSDAYSPDYDWTSVTNAGEIRKGGTGYCISLGADGKEHFDQSKNVSLSPEIEAMFPDYSIYPQFPFAVAMTSRGCPRGCAFCHVAAKEGKCAVKVADVSDFWRPSKSGKIWRRGRFVYGQPTIQVMDPNITACREKRDLFRQYRETGAKIEFNQGLDIRLLNDADIEDINAMDVQKIHFAWDQTDVDLTSKFENYQRKTNKRVKGSYGTVYCLTNFDDCSVEEHVRRALWRIYTLRDMKFDPYLMIYDKPHAPKVLRDMQRWCNNKRIFKSCPKFGAYDRRKETNHKNVIRLVGAERGQPTEPIEGQIGLEMTNNG